MNHALRPEVQITGRREQYRVGGLDCLEVADIATTVTVIHDFQGAGNKSNPPRPHNIYIYIYIYRHKVYTSQSRRLTTFFLFFNQSQPKKTQRSIKVGHSWYIHLI